MYDEIIRQSLEHINPNDVILTFSQSDLLFSFLKEAHNGADMGKSHGKNFEVLVCETAPTFTGHMTAS